MPAGSPFTTKLTCGRPFTATHGLALYELATTPPMLEVLDVSDPLKAVLLCLLSPAQGGSFDQAPNELVFWIGDQLGSADLSSGQVVLTARLPMPAFMGAYSHDGATFAYRASVDPAGSVSTRIDNGGYDRELHLQAPVLGHGGSPPSQGPFDQLAFSADGTELLDFNAYGGASGLDNFLVYRTTGILGTYAPPDGFLIFQSPSAAHGAWSPTGSTLYFFMQGQSPGGEIDSLDTSGRRLTLASGLDGFYWPRVMPAGGSIVYHTFVIPPGDTCGGLPHLWAFDLAIHVASQLSAAISAEPTFVTRTVLWSNEQEVGQCRPGGQSAANGVILAHDMSTGRDSVVDMTQTVPGIGGPPLPPSSTSDVLDVWF